MNKDVINERIAADEEKRATYRVKQEEKEAKKRAKQEAKEAKNRVKQEAKEAKICWNYHRAFSTGSSASPSP